MSTIRLRSYQERARDFLLATPRAVLGDVPGVGKTFPAIDAAQQASPNARKLVVVPAYLVYQWRDAILAYLGPGTDVVVLRSSDPPVPVEFTGWVVTSYHTVESAFIRPPRRTPKEGAVTRPRVSKHTELLSLPWGAVLADEAHRFRGRNSNWTKNAYQIKSEHFWMLTGTPLVNNPGDIWPLLKLCSPKVFRSYWKFVGEWCVLEPTQWGITVHGVIPGKEQAFYDMLRPHLLRRRFPDIREEENAAGADTRWMDDPIPHFIRVELPPALKKAHDAAKESWFIEHPDLSETHIASSGGALVTKLRKLTSGVLEFGDTDVITTNPKINAVLEVVSDHPNEPFVVFTWFRSTAQAIANRLAHAGNKTFVITGAVNAQTRAQRIKDWMREPNAVIVATMSCMQEGVNLQKANHIIFAEHDYLPSGVKQAIAREQRYGQDKRVNVFHIMAIGTADESVWRVMHGRHANITRALLEDLKVADLPLDTAPPEPPDLLAIAA